jgi:hypothetical protein
MNYCLSRLVCLNLRATIRRDSLLIRMALCALFPLLLDACGGMDHRPYPSFDRVEIVTDSVPVDMPLAKSKIDMAKDAPAELAVGTAVVAGFGLGFSLLCGPAFMVCAELIVLPAIVEPVLTGLTVGVGVGLLVGMSEEEAQEVNDYFEALPKRRDLNQELVIAVSADLPGARLATADGDARLTLGMRRVVFFQEPNDLFALSLMFEANMEWDLGKKKQGNDQRTHSCMTEYHKADTWLADSGRKFDEAIDLCLNKVSQQITTAAMKKKGAVRA